MTGRCIGLLSAFAALLAAGLSTGVPVYYALAIATGALICVSLLAVLLVRQSLRVRTDMPVLHAQRGESVTLHIRTYHTGLLPIGAIEASLMTATEPENITIDSRPLRWKEHSFTIDCPHRGVYMAGVREISVYDVFGLFHLRKKIRDCSFTIEISPRVPHVAALQLGAGDFGPEAPSSSTEDDASPSGIREWREGDVLKKIHWKLSMRKRELVVRTFDESAKPDILILLDLAPIGALRSHALAIEDAACEAAAAAAMAHLSEGYPVRMPLSSSNPIECSGRSPADMHRFLEALTSVRFDCRYPFEKLLAVEMRRTQRTGGAILITSHLGMRTADIAMQMRKSGLDVQLHWITESHSSDGNELVARLALSGVEVKKCNPYEARN